MDTFLQRGLGQNPDKTVVFLSAQPFFRRNRTMLFLIFALNIVAPMSHRCASSRSTALVTASGVTAELQTFSRSLSTLISGVMRSTATSFCSVLVSSGMKGSISEKGSLFDARCFLDLLGWGGRLRRAPDDLGR